MEYAEYQEYIYIQSFLVWFLWWLRHGAMDPFEGTHLGECWRTDLRFTHFNLVIPFLTFFILLHSSLRYLGKSSFAQMKLHGTVWNWFLSQDRNGVENMAFMDHGRLEASCFQVWSTFFCCFFWWGWTYCAPNSFELEKPFNAHLWVWLATVPSMEKRTTLFLGTESH